MLDIECFYFYYVCIFPYDFVENNANLIYNEPCMYMRMGEYLHE